MKRHGYVSLFVFALMAGAQDQQVAHISGRLHSPEPFLQGYTVELDGLTPQHCRAPQADVHVDGEFSLRNVPFGDYLLRVSDIAGNIVAQQLVGVPDHESPIDIRLPPRPQLPTGATVSVAQLLHPPARKAILAAATAQ